MKFHRMKKLRQGEFVVSYWKKKLICLSCSLLPPLLHKVKYQPGCVLVSLNFPRFVDVDVHASITVVDSGFPKGHKLPGAMPTYYFAKIVPKTA